METERKPPTREEVLEYAEKNIEYYLQKHASQLPEEQKNEIRQESVVRILNSFHEIEPDLGWKSFIQKHCFGTVMDYRRGGDGFQESGIQTSKDGRPPMKYRIDLTDPHNGSEISLDHALGINGIFHNDEDEESLLDPNWDLLARMAAVDPDVHLVAKIARGFTQEQLAKDFGVSRERLSQRLREFAFKLDDECGSSPWVRQILYAMGLEEAYGVPFEDRGDNGLGWNVDPIDLDSAETLSLMSGFKQAEFGF